METKNYKEQNGIWFYKTDRNHVTITWRTGYAPEDKKSKTFLTEEHAIKYINDNKIHDVLFDNKQITTEIREGLQKSFQRKKEYAIKMSNKNKGTKMGETG